MQFGKSRNSRPGVAPLQLDHISQEAYTGPGNELERLKEQWKAATITSSRGLPSLPIATVRRLVTGFPRQTGPARVALDKLWVGARRTKVGGEHGQRVDVIHTPTSASRVPVRGHGLVGLVIGDTGWTEWGPTSRDPDNGFRFWREGRDSNLEGVSHPYQQQAVLTTQPPPTGPGSRILSVTPALHT